MSELVDLAALPAQAARLVEAARAAGADAAAAVAARHVHAAAMDLFQMAGSTASRDGQRMQRLIRDLGTYWSHNTPSQHELLAQTLAMLHLGFSKDQLPSTGA